MALPSRFVATVVIASFLPCHGEGAVIFSWLTTLAIAIMFFMQGARLSRDAVISGFAQWRLHVVILASTFVLFPILGFGFRALFPHLISPPMLIGLLYICLLPSTVQSSIAFTLHRSWQRAGGDLRGDLLDPHRRDPDAYHGQPAAADP